MIKSRTAFLLVATVLTLAGCGTTTTDRALSGGAIGAGVGAVGGAIVGGMACASTRNGTT